MLCQVRANPTGPAPAALTSASRTWDEANLFLFLAFFLGLQHGKSAHRRAILRPILAHGGSPPLGGLLFPSQILRYHHRSHTMTTALTYRALSHKALTHHALSYCSQIHRSLTHRALTHCSLTMTTALTMTTSSAVSRRNGTKALPPARLPGAQFMKPTLSQGAPW